VQCSEVHGQYVTLVNPQPHKGVFLFVRIAHELARLRPDIPFLVKEGRGRARWLNRTGLDLRGLSNLYFMEHTPDPREFYQASRIVLMPSVWDEAFGRVAAEAMINGIPVLASRRGALSETLAEGGILIDVPDKFTPALREVATPEEVAPWVEKIIQLWDDPVYYAQERQRCLKAAEAWRPERLAARFDALLRLI
jgi:glycosyltransferase involved in cell wall biosynthesis